MADKLMAAVPNNLAELPLAFPEIQVGYGLHADTPLLPEQREAVEVFFALIEPYWKEPGERKVLTPEKWREILSAYQNLLLLMMGEYCVITRLAAAFELDDEALATVAGAEQSLIGCYGCHGMI